MTPLFPLPRAADLNSDTWNVDREEQILVRGDLQRITDEARRFYRRRHAGGLPSDLDARYCELLVRAWLAAHLVRFAPADVDDETAATEHLECHVFARMNKLWRSAAVLWLHRLIVTPPGETSPLTGFTPRRYVLEMCRLLDVSHPFEHHGPAGQAQAIREQVVPA